MRKKSKTLNNSATKDAITIKQTPFFTTLQALPINKSLKNFVPYTVHFQLDKKLHQRNSGSFGFKGILPCFFTFFYLVVVFDGYFQVRLTLSLLFLFSLSSQGSVDMDAEELSHPPDLRQSYHGRTEDFSSQEKTGGEEADIDSTSCTNSHGSSLSGRRDLEEFDADGVEDELGELKTVAALHVMHDEGDERERSLGFDLNTVCEEGKTLLWDLIQDDIAVNIQKQLTNLLP